MSIELVVGDPARGPATMTRFALPFRYSPERLAGTSAGAEFRETTLDDMDARRKYFTPETAQALFDRARWFRWVNPNDASAQPVEVNFKLSAHDGGPVIKGQMQTSAVLMEAETAFRVRDLNHDVLHTGFLLIDLTFPAGERLLLDDLLLVNESFRYWRSPFDIHRNKTWTYSRDGIECRTTYESFASGIPGVDAKDSYTARWSSFLSAPFRLKNDDHLYRVVPEAWIGEAAGWIEHGVGDGGWIASTDERAFVWTCAITRNGSFDFDGDGDGRDSGHWVRLVNVDRPSSSQSTPFEQEWVARRTYARWAHFGTLYGLNEHSGAMIASPCNEPPLCRHFMGMYFDQQLLLLYSRATTFRMSHELSRSHAAQSRWIENTDQLRSLRDSFARFANLYYFPLLTTQQQGVEMYTYARTALDIDALFKEIQTQIETTHEYLELRLEGSTTEHVRWLTVVGTIAVIMTLMLTADAIRLPLERLLAPTRHPLVFSTLLAFAAGLVALTIGRPAFAASVRWWKRRGD